MRKMWPRGNYVRFYWLFLQLIQIGMAGDETVQFESWRRLKVVVRWSSNKFNIKLKGNQCCAKPCESNLKSLHSNKICNRPQASLQKSSSYLPKSIGHHRKSSKRCFTIIVSRWTRTIESEGWSFDSILSFLYCVRLVRGFQEWK